MTTTANGFTTTRNGMSPLAEAAPPHSLDDERGLLGSIIIDAGRVAEVCAIVASGDFYSPAHRAIFNLVVELQASTGSVDPVMLSSRWKSDAAYAGAEGVLLELFGAVPISSNAAHFAQTVRDLSLYRKAVTLGESLIARAHRRESLHEICSTANREGQSLADALEGVNHETRRFRTITAAELAGGDYCVDYIVEGILAKGQPCGLLGPQKALKTSLAIDLAVAIATGGFFLGKWRVNGRRRVLMMSGESGLATIQETAARVCDAAFKTLAEIDGLSFCDVLPRFGNSVDLAELSRLLKSQDVEVLFIDPLYLCIDVGGSEGSIYAMGAALRGVSELCQSLGVTLILAHHLKKSVVNPYQPGELSDASWAGIAEYCRQWLIINRRGPYEHGSGVHKLWLSVGGSAGHSGLWGVDVDEGVGHGNRHWSVGILTADEVRGIEVDHHEERRQAKAAEKAEADVRRLLDRLAKFPDGETKGKLRELLAVSGDKINAQIAAALDRDCIEPCDVIKHGRTEAGYRLKTGGEI